MWIGELGSESTVEWHLPPSSAAAEGFGSFSMRRRRLHGKCAYGLPRSGSIRHSCTRDGSCGECSAAFASIAANEVTLLKLLLPLLPPPLSLTAQRSYTPSTMQASSLDSYDVFQPAASRPL